MTEQRSDEISIQPLRARDIHKFVKLRNEIDRATAFMPSSGGGRLSVVMALIRYLLHRKRVFTYLAERDGQIVGFITLILGRFRKFRGNAYIANVSVKASERGSGIGTLLMDKGEELARQKKARRLELEVFAKNLNALKLYEKLGFEVEGRKRKAIENPDGYDDLIFMAKFL